MYRILNTHSDFSSIVKIGNSGLIIRRTIAMSSSQIIPLFFFLQRKRSMLILAWYGGGQIMIITDLYTVQLPDSVIGGSNPKKKEILFSLSS